jgi:hypothetical protein
MAPIILRCSRSPLKGRAPNSEAENKDAQREDNDGDRPGSDDEPRAHRFDRVKKAQLGLNGQESRGKR